MVSKLIQIQHLSMEYCTQYLSHYRYTESQILKRESEIMELAEWEISTRTTSYEAFELLLMMIKSRV